jgi:ABC-type sugar transport system ATPase subunit
MLEGGLLTVEAIARELVVEGSTPEARGAGGRAARPLLRIEGWTHAQAFRGVTMDVPAGRIVALMGVEGSGGRELLRGIGGLERVVGRTTLKGAPAAPGASAAYVPAARTESLFGNFSVGENVLARLGRPEIAGPAGALLRRRMRRLATEAISRFLVKARSIDQPIRSLSGGNQQKVAIAQAMAKRPLVLLLEEPTRGVDIQSKAEIYRLLEAYAAEGHAVVLFCTEALEAFEAADQVRVLSDGRLRGVIEVRAHASAEDLAAAIVQEEDHRQAA